MDKLPKEELISNIELLQNRLRDVIHSYRSLKKEKEALENGLRAIKNVPDNDGSESSVSSQKDDEAGSSEEPKYSAQVTMLMNSLSSLSAEKSRMEASFQADKKKLRQEREKCEVTIRELQDKIKSLNLEHSKEKEQLKTYLIIERHEREKEQNECQSQIQELQQFLKQEHDSKMFLEKTLNDLSSREELERHKVVQRSEKIMSLQQAHMSAVEQEKHKAQKKSQQAYEQRIASLESKLAELSITLAKYNRCRQEDQNEIFKLREKIKELSSFSSKVTLCEDAACQTTFTETLAGNSEENVRFSMENSHKLPHFEEVALKPKKHLEQNSLASTSKDKDLNSNLENELKNFKIKIHMLSDQNTLLNEQYNNTVTQYEKILDDTRKHHILQASKYDEQLREVHKDYRAQISDLEIQVQKQRERTIALLEEKDQEVATLKSSFQLFVPGNKLAFLPEINNDSLVPVSQLDEVLDGSPTINAQENPHILYYSHELARRDVVITGLRKTCCQLENSLRDVKKELILFKQSSLDVVNNLNGQINRLERCQSREGANLEYLKNVIVNYLHSKDASSKRHMLNAIAVILKLTDTEINKIQKAL